MSALTEFLLARIAEDEREADQSVQLPSGLLHIGRPDAPLLLVWSPARVLAECEAKRRIVDEAFDVAATVDGEWACCHDADDIRRGGRLPEFDGDEFEPLPGSCAGREVAEKFLRLLALPYAGHESFKEEWRAD